MGVIVIGKGFETIATIHTPEAKAGPKKSIASLPPCPWTESEDEVYIVSTAEFDGDIVEIHKPEIFDTFKKAQDYMLKCYKEITTEPLSEMERVTATTIASHGTFRIQINKIKKAKISNSSTKETSKQITGWPGVK